MSVIFTAVLALICWILIAFFDRPLLMLFGADESLLPLAREYLLPIKFVVPAFMFTQMLTAFLRNDNDPNLATIAVLSGGVFNIVGDILFVFVFDMGIFGAGLATAIGGIISIITACMHFVKKKNTLKLIKTDKIVYKIKKITITGFSTFIMDMAMGIIAILFNNQIMNYSGADALAVYGVIVNITTFVQCSAYGAGQAAQPIMSINLGARQHQRVKETLKYSVGTVAVFGVFWLTVVCLFPLVFVHFFMKPTAEVLEIAPGIVRTYGVSYLFLPFNIFSTYYFQAVLKPKTSLGVSLARGALLSGSLIILLPAVFGADAMWFAMPITELAVAVAAVYFMVRYTKKL